MLNDWPQWRQSMKESYSLVMELLSGSSPEDSRKWVGLGRKNRPENTGALAFTVTKEHNNAFDGVSQKTDCKVRYACAEAGTQRSGLQAVTLSDVEDYGLHRIYHNVRAFKLDIVARIRHQLMLTMQ